jgi:hypothetical protein
VCVRRCVCEGVRVHERKDLDCVVSRRESARERNRRCVRERQTEGVCERECVCESDIVNIFDMVRVCMCVCVCVCVCVRERERESLRDHE